MIRFTDRSNIEDINFVHEQLGLLTLITPFIKEKNEELNNTKKKLEEFQRHNESVVFLEGRTDEKYFNKTLEVFGYKDVPLRFSWIGHLNDKGQEENTGKDALNKAVHFLIAMDLSIKCVCLFDSDTSKKEKDENNVFIRVIPLFENTKKMKKGVENALILDDIDLDSFYKEKQVEGDYGEIKSISEFDKMSCCDKICSLDSSVLKNVFQNLKVEIDKLIQLVNGFE